MGRKFAVNVEDTLTSATADEYKTMLAIRAADTAGQTPVAAIKMEDAKIRFGWWPQSASPERADHLLNCGLDITVDGRHRFLPLGRIEQVDPVVLHPARGLDKVILPKDRLPKPESLQLQIVRFDGFPEEQQSSVPSELFKSGKAARAAPKAAPKAGFEVAEEAY